MSEIEAGVLAGAHSYWKAVNLTGLLRDLDATGLAIVDNQKTSLQERRKLAEKTKEFRTVPDESKAVEFKPLLRAYQNEIDALTKRMKFAENEFLRLFKSLSEAPDPEPFLASLGDERRQRQGRADTERECARLSARAELLAAENAELRAKKREADAQTQRLESLEASMDAMVSAQVEQRDHELRAQHEDLVQHLKARETDLQRQLSAATRKLTEAQQTQDSDEAERLTRAQSNDRELIGKLAELEILQSDYDHATARVADLQLQNAKLRAEITALAPDTEGAETLAEYRRRVHELDDETTRLFAALESADAELALHRSQSEAAAGARDEQAHARDEELRRARAELQRYADYDEIKRDLEIMKSVEFAVSDWGLDDASEAPKTGTESLERLLVARNKALENRLIDARNELAQSQDDVQQLRDRASAQDAELQRTSALAARLESDLLAVGTDTDALHSNKDDIELKPTASGLLDIVTGQRDRFRQRNIELEDELRVQAAAATEHGRQAEQTKQDNVRLYEEVKYLRSYATRTGESSRPAPTPSKFSTAAHHIDMDTSVDAKYKTMYEESLNPFHVFHRRETTRRVRSMGVLDRLIYMFSSAVVGSRRARMVMLLYVALLHLLVMITLYRTMLQADEGSFERAPPIM
ncbi:hypothetical protein GGH12_003512 [Coemansia sp. RSA 1822]|nr:hypothetical protein LPJ76_001530 [Coemansia sp. RSA 638]KAJ2545038.1 hypothetical protein GGF49_000797 [Coemansia sp. RSA 1853]KAJ2562051.1 hypothetical protein GGH12_003512 [Coemansia sp. RSA 1822]